MQELIQSTYNQVKPREILFVFKTVLRLQLKDPIFYLDKSCIVYKSNCFCEKRYIRQTSRHLKTKVNENIHKCVINFIKEKTNSKTKAAINATKRFTIAEHLINNIYCANNYDKSRYNVINKSTNSIDSVRLEAISIFLNKPELCKQNEFDYKVFFVYLEVSLLNFLNVSLVILFT